ncbi:hypothetical protein V2J09_023151 [Rumex salicifolius]
MNFLFDLCSYDALCILPHKTLKVLVLCSASQMGSKKKSKSSSKSSSTSASSTNGGAIASGLRQKHQQELESLNLIKQPLRTLKFFNLAVFQYCKRLVHYVLSKGSWLVVLGILLAGLGVYLATSEGFYEKLQHIRELLQCGQFVLWWTALGVASSIGLGSGLHTFVLYLGPHIALFTIKAMQCGRVDLKSTFYDTIQFNRGPSWLDKDCSEFGPPLFESTHGLRVPLMSIFPPVQLEVILWGLGTALGELPPYFISRAASLSCTELDSMEKLDASLAGDSGNMDVRFNKMKRWLMSHTQFLNFGTILLLASVPNPLFDLAGIMCGQFGIPFWEFFFATLIGKALVKTHIQTVFIISVCNNQLLHWVENDMIWVLSFIPGLPSVLPSMINKLHGVKDRYLTVTPPGPPDSEVKKWRLSLGSIWNTVIWLVLINFFFKIINSTAQGFLKKRQEEELVAVSKKKKPTSKH